MQVFHTLQTEDGDFKNVWENCGDDLSGIVEANEVFAMNMTTSIIKENGRCEASQLYVMLHTTTILLFSITPEYQVASLNDECMHSSPNSSSKCGTAEG